MKKLLLALVLMTGCLEEPPVADPVPVTKERWKDIQKVHRIETVGTNWEIPLFAPRLGNVTVEVKGQKDKVLMLTLIAPRSARSISVYSYKPFWIGKFRPEKDKWDGKYLVELSLDGGLSVPFSPGSGEQSIIFSTNLGLTR